MSEKGKKRKEQETTTCKLPGCHKPVFSVGGKVFEYCCKTHGKQDSANAKKKKLDAKKVEVKYETTQPKPDIPPWNETWAKIKETIPPARTPVKLPTKEARYAQLVKYMLSGRTTDENVDIAFKKLEEHGISREAILAMDLAYLENLLAGVSSAAEKASRIQRTSKILKTQYDGDVPSTTNDLLDLPGVGPKIATMVLRYCWGINSGISVDVHIHRVCNRLGWVKTNEPVATKNALEAFVPIEEWSDLGALYKFGKYTCTAYSPKCASCPVSQVCPSSKV